MYARITSVGNSVTSIRLLWQLDSCFNKVFIYFLGNESQLLLVFIYAFKAESLNAAGLSFTPGCVSVCIANSLNGTGSDYTVLTVL